MDELLEADRLRESSLVQTGRVGGPHDQGREIRSEGDHRGFHAHAEGRVRRFFPRVHQARGHPRRSGQVERKAGFREEVESVGRGREPELVPLAHLDLRFREEHQVVQRHVGEGNGKERTESFGREGRNRRSRLPPGQRVQVVGEQFPDVVGPQRDHRQTGDPDPPGGHGNVDAQRAEHFGPEHASRKYLDPAEPGMAHPALDRRFGEREVARSDLELRDPDGPRELPEHPYEVAQGHAGLPDDPLALAEFEMVARIDRLDPEVPIDGVDPERRGRALSEVAGADGRCLRPEHGSRRDSGVVAPPPSRTQCGGFPGQGATFVRCGHAGEEVLCRRTSREPLWPEGVVDRPGRVVLRHEEDVIVPEFGFEDRPLALLESEPDEELRELVEPRTVGILPNAPDERDRRPNIVRSEPAALPGTGDELGRG